MKHRILAWLFAAGGAALGAAPDGVAIIEKRCVACHSGSAKKSGLDVTGHEALLRGGDRGPAIVPGNANASLLYRVIARLDAPHMPFQSPKLPEAEVTAIADWINQGAQFPQALTASTVKHWAFQVPKRPPVPALRNKAWVRNPIDAFLAAEHEKRGLNALGAADPNVLLRRVYLDVIGLPPTREELRQFLEDRSANAYEKVVDRLLSDPRYGQRWGRHWMDVWRYSDWYGWRKGNDVRNSHKFIWRWRDWIVDSLNADKSFDRMIVEMIAGDEIAPNDPKILPATGFLVRNFSKYDRNGWMQDAVDHTAMGMLGITLKCARCHDHKYDPFTQTEYYRMRAFLEPYEVRIDRVTGEPDTDKDGLSRVFDADVERPTYLLVRGDIQSPDKSQVLEPGTPHSLGGKLPTIEPVALGVPAYYPDFRPFVHADLTRGAQADIERAETELRKAQEESAKVEQATVGIEPKAAFAQLREASDKLELAQKALAAAKAYLPALQARIEADKAKYADPPDTRYEELADKARKLEREAGILKAVENVARAEFEFQAALKDHKPDSVADAKKITEAQKKLTDAQTALTQNAEGYLPLGKIYPDRSSGRRTALARWIASPDNPLTARVAVNHIWLRHFGRALVPTVFDFGMNGKPPTHPELLDWLATEFMRSKWSMKAIHRLILTSSAYRMQSSVKTESDSNEQKDPENQYVWRMNSRRMEAEIVRDSILYLAGQLDQSLGGPEIEDFEGLKTRRRSLYFAHSPDVQVEFLKIFDVASPAECYERNESVVPQQALALANSKISRAQSRVLAKRIHDQLGPSETSTAFVKAAFETVLGRVPSAAEQTAGERFLNRQPGLDDATADRDLRTRENFIHVLFNHNDFVTIR